MGEVLNQNLQTTAHYLVSEAAGHRSRDAGLIAASSGDLKAGAVMGVVSASGEYAPFNPTAADGTETAAAILFDGAADSTATQRRTFTVRDAEVHADVLVFADGTTDPQKNAAIASLQALGIVAR